MKDYTLLMYVSPDADKNFESMYKVQSGKQYMVEISPTMYDPNTFEAINYFIIKGDDGKFRKMEKSHSDNLISLEDWRIKRLDLLI
jgi:hypothetical protein